MMDMTLWQSLGPDFKKLAISASYFLENSLWELWASMEDVLLRNHTESHGDYMEREIDPAESSVSHSSTQAKAQGMWVTSDLPD